MAVAMIGGKILNPDKHQYLATQEISSSKLFVLDSAYSALPDDVLDNIKTFLYYKAKMRFDKDLDKSRFDSFLVPVSFPICTLK